MPKKILYESAIHQFLWAGKRLQAQLRTRDHAQADRVARWFRDLTFQNPGSGALLVSWLSPQMGARTIPLKGAKFYTRGDAEVHAQRQAAAGLPFANDRVMDANVEFFNGELRSMLGEAGVLSPTQLDQFLPQRERGLPGDLDRKHAEEVFHDEWAAREDVSLINVRHRNEACTAPEMRHIRARLGDLRGRTLLDIGCGLGEAAVYFAMEGARVTATDISPGMCETTQKLATANSVTVETHVSAIEDLGLGSRQFDIIYTGNTLHHADIAALLDNVLPHLKADGVWVSWDPVAYNPIINIYRAIATQVRTEDEHPLRLKDIRAVTGRFEEAEVSWYWLTALLIFMLMVVAQFRSPNKERFWKKVVDEAEAWAWLYRPLAALDRAVIAIFPFLGALCWNVVIIAKRPKLGHRLSTDAQAPIRTDSAPLPQV